MEAGMMRTSNYIHYVTIPETKEHFLVHGYSGAVDKVSPHVVRFLLERRDNDKSTHVKDEKVALESLANVPVEPLDDSCIEMLSSRGYLTIQSVEEERDYVRSLTRWFHERAVRGVLPGFMLIPTYECNVRCPYCFETQTRIDLNKQERLNAVMSVETADAAFATMDVLFERRKPESISLEDVRKGRSIGLYGGEPLQAMTRDIVEYVLKKGRSKGFRFMAITNGIDLHLFEDLLGPEGIEWIQVTLDGPKDVHDKNRIGPKNRQSYDKIMANLEVAVARGTRIAVRLHTDWASVDRTPGILDELNRRRVLENKNFSIYATPRHHWHVGQEFPIYPNIAECQLHQKVQSLPPVKGKPMDVSGMNLVESKLTKYIKGGLAGLANTIEFCNANTGGMHLLDLYGDIYACWDTVGKPAERIGTYSVGGPTYTSRARDWSGRCPADIPECSNCKYVMFHFGGCACLPVSVGYGLLHPACRAFQDAFSMIGKDFFFNGRHNMALEVTRPETEEVAAGSQGPMVPELIDIASQ